MCEEERRERRWWRVRRRGVRGGGGVGSDGGVTWLSGRRGRTWKRHRTRNCGSNTVEATQEAARGWIVCVLREDKSRGGEASERKRVRVQGERRAVD